jgi:hypothetical protein
MRKRLLLGVTLLVGLVLLGRPGEARACGGVASDELVVAVLVVGGTYAGSTIYFGVHDLTVDEPSVGYGVAEAVVNTPLALLWGAAFLDELEDHGEYDNNDGVVWLGAFTALHTTLAVHGMYTAGKRRPPKRQQDLAPPRAPNFGPPGTVQIGRVRGSVLAGPVSDGRSVAPGRGFAGSF